MMRIIRPDYVPEDKIKFFERYCDPFHKYDQGVIEFLGTSNQSELSLIFEKRFQVKSDKYSSSDEAAVTLGSKRIKIEIEGDLIIQGCIQEHFQQFFLTNQGAFEEYLTGKVDNELVAQNVANILKKTAFCKI